MSLWRRAALCLLVICLLQFIYILTHLNINTTIEPPTTVKHVNRSLWYHYKRLFVPQTAISEQERLTLVMLTYKREDILPRVTKHYCTMTDSLRRILIIWNDVTTPISKATLGLSSKCQVELKFIVSKENKLTNRFLPREEIITEGVIVVDDDRLISSEDVHFGLQIWQQFRHKIVGFEHRMHSVTKGGVYHYGPSPQLGYSSEKYGYSMLISASFILHKLYFELFHSSYLPVGLFEYVNEEMNCEDIAMCVMVAKFLGDTTWPQSSVLSIKPKVTLRNLEAVTGGDHRGLSNKAQHYGKRSECLNKFASFYRGTLPLVYTSGRIYREPFNPWYNFKLT